MLEGSLVVCPRVPERQYKAQKVGHEVGLGIASFVNEKCAERERMGGGGERCAADRGLKFGRDPRQGKFRERGWRFQGTISNVVDGIIRNQMAERIH